MSLKKDEVFPWRELVGEILKRDRNVHVCAARSYLKFHLFKHLYIWFVFVRNAQEHSIYTAVSGITVEGIGTEPEDKNAHAEAVSRPSIQVKLVINTILDSLP